MAHSSCSILYIYIYIYIYIYLYIHTHTNTSSGTRRCPEWPMAKPDSLFFFVYPKILNNLWTCVTVKCAPCYLRKTPLLIQNTQTCKKKKTTSWMNAMSCSTSNTKTKTCNKIVMLYSVRNVTEVLLDIQCSLFSFLEQECKDLLCLPPSNVQHIVDQLRNMDFPDGFPQFPWIVLGLCWLTLRRQGEQETGAFWSRMASL